MSKYSVTLHFEVEMNDDDAESYDLNKANSGVGPAIRYQAKLRHIEKILDDYPYHPLNWMVEPGSLQMYCDKKED